MNKVTINAKVNGNQVIKEVEPRLLLADFLREDLGLVGTHLGCEHGVCGSCTVRLNNESVRSCLVLTPEVNGAEIETVESLANEDGTLNRLQKAFSENHALQCGFCTPGFLMTLVSFLERNPSPSEEEIREAISGNLCRCTGYSNIIKAVQDATKLTVI